MVSLGFGICLIVSACVTVYMAARSYDNVDSYYWTIAVLIPLLILAYWLKVQVASPEAALILIIEINLLSLVLLVVMLFSMLQDLGISLFAWVKPGLYIAVLAHVILFWILVRDKKPDEVVMVTDTGHGYATRLEVGAANIVSYGYFLVLLIGLVGVISIIFLKRKTASRRTLLTYLALAGTGAAIYTAEALLDTDFSVMPVLYMFASIILAGNYGHISTHDIKWLIPEYQNYQSPRGYMAVGLNGQYLSCNEHCYRFLPALREQRIDSSFPRESELNLLIYNMIGEFRENGIRTSTFHAGDMICACDISYFSTRFNGKPRGYFIEIRDATREYRDMEKLKNYNEHLNEEVSEKTKDIENIQNKIVLGMADMIENRDSNTGGHVRRTSDVIKILISEILRQQKIPLQEQLARNIVRAAPMHDLGKISIDSNILNKPGRLTQEEYTIMKTHSTISGQMVKILLDGVEEESFVRTAYHVARYHHERWDGKGYPEGLVGTMIPLEARIMAVADVYDALVSKRVYKEPMSYQKAEQIMKEGMGTQFDPNMRAVFLGCKDQLEIYYDQANAAQ